MVFTLLACTVGDSADSADSAPGLQRGELPPTVLLITIDTLRADHIDPAFTPFLSALADEGVVFANMGAQTWTYPGLGAIVTGRHPAAWNYESFVGNADGPGTLSPSIPTLAEGLAAEGWATGLWSANPIAEMTGLNRGYETYEEYLPGATTSVAPELVTWLAAHEDTPRFLHLHLNDDHSPYDIVSDTCSAAVAAVDTGECRWDFIHSNDDSVYANQQVNDGLFTPESEDYDACVALLRTTYGCEVTRQDEELRAVWAALEVSGQIADALTVVAADHGEGLLDPWTNHGFDQRMPIVEGWGMMRWPGHVVPGIEARPMSQEDIVPTIGALIGVALPNQGIPVDELPEERVRTTFYGGEVPGHPWGIVHAAYDANYHYIRRVDGSCDLYDRVADPHELTDVCTGLPPENLAQAVQTQLEATAGWAPPG